MKKFEDFKSSFQKRERIESEPRMASFSRSQTRNKERVIRDSTLRKNPFFKTQVLDTLVVSRDAQNPTLRGSHLLTSSEINVWDATDCNNKIMPIEVVEVDEKDENLEIQVTSLKFESHSSSDSKKNTPLTKEIRLDPYFVGSATSD